MLYMINMKQLFLLLILLSTGLSMRANDGVFYAVGNTLIPVKETVVELKTEYLRLKRDAGYMVVDVDFTFHNPGPEKEVIVGFVTPPAGGDISENEASHPQVFGFTVKVNGEDLDYKIARMERSGFQLDEMVADGDDFVYHFPVTFKPGSNRIQHRYRYRGGSSVELLADFDYRITTGKMWANGEIGEFNLEIDMGDGAFYSIPTTFFDSTDEVPWKPIGETIISNPMRNFFESNVRMVKQYGKGIQLRMENFKPDYDIFIAEYQPFNEVYLWTENKEDNPFLEEPYFLLPGYGEESELYEMDKEMIALLRNYYFAKYGYAFKKKKYQEVFSKFIWYKPIPGKNVVLPKEEQEYVDLLKKVEGNL